MMQRRSLLLLALASACKRASFTCSDTSGLSADEIRTRATVGYTDLSSDPSRTCGHCQQFIESKSGGCGTCKLLKGPVHPDGTCKTFSLKG